MRVKILVSSSSGNCALVESHSGEKVLIDAGVSFKKLEKLLENEGVRADEISAVFVTHEHSDHVAGLSGFAERGTPLYMTRGTASALVKLPKSSIKFLPNAGAFEVAGLSVESFPVPHDAAEPVGYKLKDAVDLLVWALDVGHITPTLKTTLLQATILVLESNYCPAMLEKANRPFHLKQRIRGRHGHLSNDDAYEFLTTNRTENWKKIFLAHVSRECNDVTRLQERYNKAAMEVEVISPVANEKTFVYA